MTSKHASPVHHDTQHKKDTIVKDSKKTKTIKIDWVERAAALPNDEFKPTVPLGILLGEAISVARYLDAHWSASVDPTTKVSIHGLDTAGEKHLPKSTSDELRELQVAVEAAQAAFLLTVDPKAANADNLARGRFVLDEITATLEWIFDDGVEDERDAQLASVEGAHANDTDTPDLMALALDDFAALGEKYRKDMKDVGGFDIALIDEARKLAVALRGSASSPIAPSTASKAALSFRNRLLQLLQARIDLVRAAARFVYRGAPENVVPALSGYQVKRRVIAKRAATRKANAAAAAANGGAKPTATPA